MTHSRLTAGLLLASALAMGCGNTPSLTVGDAGTADGGGDAAYDGGFLRLPRHFPQPRIPADNPLTTARVELGRYLFYDRRLSGNGTQSCGSCHRQRLAFTDGRAHAIGSTGMMHRRSALGLTNVAYYAALTWANPLMRTLERQAQAPLFGEDPIELGLAGRDAEALATLSRDTRYQSMFAAAFPGEMNLFTLDHVLKAIASFERTLISSDAPYDRYVNGDHTALNPSALRGMDLFFGERMECYHCHGGFNFSDSVIWQGSDNDDPQYHNTALYNVDGRGAYPAIDTGLMGSTERPADMGRFRAPSLRNIALTAPYMHDGTVATLEDAIDHYAAGGRTIATGPNAGVGATSPLRDGQIFGFTLSPSERADVVEFLRSLTDQTFITDPRFSDPFGNE